MADCYRWLTILISPLLPLWLWLRALRGKEEFKRLPERFGYASVHRPKDTLLWLNAASVGEANSVLFLIGKMRERFPHIEILLTTGTVTSAALMQARLPKGVIHQYAPLDTPFATRRFMRHWRPDFSFWVESEFWPNLAHAADDEGSFMGVINARMSARSLKGWQRFPALIGRMLSRFDILFAQSEVDADRLKTLGARRVECLGNLKFDAALLPCDEEELLALKNAIGSRPAWLAASTHPGEEIEVANIHALLAATRPSLVTLIVPRHPGRGASIALELKKHGKTALRSLGEPLTRDTVFYIADTLGELGLFYRAAEIVFMGGSLVPHGGQNPLEPARLSCAVVTGPRLHNFVDIYAEMEHAGACLIAKNAAQVAGHITLLLNQPERRHAMEKAAREWVESKSGAAERLLERLAPLFVAKAAA